MSYAMAKLKSSISRAVIYFDEEVLLRRKRYNHIKAMDAMINHANECIKGMMWQINKDKLCLLISMAAIFLPTMDNTSLTIILELCQQSKVMNLQLRCKWHIGSQALMNTIKRSKVIPFQTSG
eukprot:4129498-Ditylum_brightwellii.AAC.1